MKFDCFAVSKTKSIGLVKNKIEFEITEMQTPFFPVTCFEGKYSRKVMGT